MSVQNVRYCKVLSVQDATDSDLIQVRLEPEDNGIKNDKDLPYAFPLLPKMFHVKPKQGEGVFVFVAVSDNSNSQRYYVGPVISQDNKLWYDGYEYAPTFMRGHEYSADKAPSTEKKCNGLLPNDDDVSIRGRKNSEIQITENDTRIKAGVKIVQESNKYNMSFNEHDPAYVKVKYHPDGLITEEKRKETYSLKNEKGHFSGYEVDYNDGYQETKQVNSTVTLVGDKINIFSTQSEENKFQLPPTDKEELINDETLRKALDEAYKLPYGEKLVDILNVFITAFLKHTHPFAMKTPVESENIKRLNEKKAVLLDRGELLSDTVRIN